MTRGQKIKYLRENQFSRKWSQTELGEKIGVKFGTISKYEKDEIDIPSENLKKIANVLNTSIDYLEDLTDNPKIDIFKEPMIIAASMKNGIDISDMCEEDKEVIRAVIEGIRARRNKN